MTLYYLEFWGLDPNKEPEHPEQILLGRKVCSSLENLFLKTRLTDWRWKKREHQKTLHQNEEVHWKHNHVSDETI